MHGLKAQAAKRGEVGPVKVTLDPARLGIPGGVAGGALGILIYTTCGLLFEFYVGINRSQGHTLGQLRAMGERPTSMRKFLGD